MTAGVRALAQSLNLRWLIREVPGENPNSAEPL